MNVRPPNRRRLASPFLAVLLLSFVAGAPAQEPKDAAPSPLADTSPKAGAAEPEASGTKLLAIWKGGQLTEAGLEGWRAFEDPSSAEASAAPSDDEIRELVFWKSLAKNAEYSGLATTPRIRLQLDIGRQAVLVPALRRQVVSKVSVSDHEVDSVLREHPDAFHRPRKLKLRNIYERFGSSDQAAAVRKHMREIHRQLVAGADFGELAKKESQSQSAPRGGALGYVDPEKLPPPVAAAVGKLSPGEISPPIEHGQGISIFQCEDIQEAHVPTPEEARAKIRSRLEARAGREAWTSYRESLFAAAKPKIDPTSSTTALELPGYHLDAVDLGALVEIRWGRAGVTPRPEVLRQLLHGWAIDVLAERRAVELGLDEARENAAKLRWKRLQVLAHAELGSRLRAELPKATEEQLRGFLEEHRARYRQPAAYDLAVIDFGKPDPEHGEALVERATAVARKIAAGELAFEEAARRYSKGATAPGGGGIGWKTRREIALWGPTASRAIFHLQPGQTTTLLHLEPGLEIYELRGQRPARDRPLEEVEDQVRTDWLQPQLPDLEAKLRRRYLDGIGLELRPAAGPHYPVIRWTTATEYESYGFDVYRGPTAKGPFERVTPKPISGAGTSDVPHSYEFRDTTARPGTVYYYYVEAISTSGSRRRMTPVKASKGSAS